MRMMTIAGLGLALFGLAVMGQSQENKKDKAAAGAAANTAAKAQKADSFVVVGYLEKRDRIITLKSGPQGPVYSVATRDGKVLLENVSLEGLKAKASEIHDFLKTSVAGGIGYLDASLFPASGASGGGRGMAGY